MPDATSNQLNFDEVRIDIGSRELRNGDQLIALEPKAFNLLIYLLTNRNRAV